MVKSCSVDTCRNRGDAPDGGKRSYFTFPLKYPSICQEWLSAIKKQHYVPTRNSYVCQDHFAATDILIRDQRKILKRFAVPFFPQKANRKGQPKKVRTEGGFNLDPKPSKDCHSYAKGRQNRGTNEESQEKIKRLEKLLKDVRLQAKRQEKTIERLKRSLEVKEEEKLRIHFDLAKDNPVQKLSGLTRALFEHEMDNYAKPKVSHRFTTQVLEFATKINDLSPELYSFMKTIFTLPTERTLSRIKAQSRSSLTLNSNLSLDPIHPPHFSQQNEPTLTENISSWMDVLK